MGEIERYEVFEQTFEDQYTKSFRARDHQAERWVSVMQLHDRFRSQPKLWEEIWATVVRRGNVKHEYLTAVYDLVKPTGWIVLEQMRGDLAEVCLGGPIEPDIVRGVLRRTLEALQWMHSHGEWHGGVYPRNLQYDREGGVKLGFSPAFMLGGQIPHQGQQAKYLAPEMLKPEFGAVSSSVDLYCLGITAIELLKGPAFDSLIRGSGGGPAVDPGMAWLRWHSAPAEQLPSAASMVPGLPADLARVIDRLLKKNVSERYSSAEEALKQLDVAAPQRLIAVAAVAAVADEKPSAPPVAAVATPQMPIPGAKPKLAPVAAPAAAKKAAVKPSTGKPGTMSQWLNDRLKNPFVMTAVICFILGITAAVISVQLEEGDKPLEVVSIPDGADIYIDGKLSKSKTNAKLTLRAAKRKIRVEKAGFVVQGEPELEIDLASSKAPASIKFELLPADGSAVTPDNTSTDEAKVPDDSTKPPVTPTVVDSKWKLPVGLVAVGTDVDAETGLPLRAVSSKLKDADAALEFVLIPAGEFTYGATGTLNTGELAESTAKIENPYYIAITEVTRKQLKVQSGIGELSFEDAAVSEISHTAATEFCTWLSPVAGLPTELEWERAARGTTGRLYPWGDSPAPSVNICNITPANPNDPAVDYKTPSILYPAKQPYTGGETPEGIRDLLGNAAEWCSDIYTAGHNDDSTPGVGVQHVIRGGSYLEVEGGALRNTWRANVADTGANDVGFRVVVRPVPPAAKSNAKSNAKPKSE